MALPKLLPKRQGYAVLREVCAMTLLAIARRAKRGTVFVSIAGKVYEAREVSK